MSDDPFAELERNNREFERQIADVPEEVITGLVDAGGAGGAGDTSGDWNLLLTLAAWKNSSGELSRESMRVKLSVTETLLNQLMNQIDPDSIIQVQARVAPHPNGFLQAIASEIISINGTDAELSLVAEELLEPMVVDDPQFGPLTLDRSVDWYSGTVIWDGAQVQLNVSWENSDDIQQALEVARKLWENEAEWAARVDNFAVSKLLELKNDSWLDEDEPQVTPAEFKARMTLEAITVYDDGDFDFWHSDGDLFWGHAIQITGNLTEGLQYADIPG
ncbi:DUF2262 domain-containing protein [Gimesia chilikensis]|uniref:DUF2262 domain-containing protein n=1 Tax=Gimesia chilikensis TaxID=2605989 RepID=UPI003A9144A8